MIKAINLCLFNVNLRDGGLRFVVLTTVKRFVLCVVTYVSEGRTASVFRKKQGSWHLAERSYDQLIRTRTKRKQALAKDMIRNSTQSSFVCGHKKVFLKTEEICSSK
jgi:hypothetical protein